MLIHLYLSGIPLYIYALHFLYDSAFITMHNLVLVELGGWVYFYRSTLIIYEFWPRLSPASLLCKLSSWKLYSKRTLIHPCPTIYGKIGKMSTFWRKWVFLWMYFSTRVCTRVRRGSTCVLSLRSLKNRYFSLTVYLT